MVNRSRSDSSCLAGSRSTVSLGYLRAMCLILKLGGGNGFGATPIELLLQLEDSGSLAKEL